MYTIKKILVTTDFSTYSAAALEYAVGLATQFKAEIHLLHIVDDDKRLQEAEQTMQKFVYENVDEYLYVVPVIRFGQPDREIVQYANEQKADLIIIATHGRTGLAHVVMGSIAERVVRRSPVPVLTVKPPTMIEQIITESDIEANLHVDETE